MYVVINATDTVNADLQHIKVISYDSPQKSCHLTHPNRFHSTFKDQLQQSETSPRQRQRRPRFGQILSNLDHGKNDP